MPGNKKTDKPNKNERELSDFQRAYWNKLEASSNLDARKISQQFKLGKLDQAALKVAYGIITDPQKIEKDSHRDFLKTIANKKFASGGINLEAFFRLLNKGNKQQKLAVHKFIKERNKKSSTGLSNKEMKRQESEFLDEEKKSLIYIVALNKDQITEETAQIKKFVNEKTESKKPKKAITVGISLDKGGNFASTRSSGVPDNSTKKKEKIKA